MGSWEFLTFIIYYKADLFAHPLQLNLQPVPHTDLLIISALTSSRLKNLAKERNLQKHIKNLREDDLEIERYI
jgi:hypothetical protein